MLIDPRTRQQILEQLKQNAELYSGWDKNAADSGATLLTLFSYMVEDVQKRLNRVPEKNFLAFLNLIGVDALPPQPARVPLTFMLAEGSREGARVPAWTQISAVLESGEEIYFETERDLYLNPTRITDIFVREPLEDRYGEYTDASERFSAFEGTHPIPHILYIARDDLFTLPETKTILLNFETLDAAKLDALPIQWSYWDGESWQPLAVEDDLITHYLWQVRIENCPVLQPLMINGLEACWLRGELLLPLAPEQISGQELLPLSERVLELNEFEPFDPARKFPCLFHLKQATTEVEQIVFTITFAQAGTPTDKLVLIWEYFNGTYWVSLGMSDVTTQVTGSGNFVDTTAAFSQDGSITFDLPADWSQDYDGGWLRVRVLRGSFNHPDGTVWPLIKSLTCDYQYMLRDLPEVEQLSVAAQFVETGLLADRAYTDTQPLDLSTDVFPFGGEPHFNSTFYLTSTAAFSKPDAEVTLNLTLTNPVNEQRSEAPLTVQPSANLVLRWEVWDGRHWQEIGLSTPQSNSAGTTAYDFSDETFCFLQNGSIRFRLPWGVEPLMLSNGDTGYWLRVRIVEGNYGIPARYEKRGDGAYELIEATYRPPVIQQITIDYRFTPDAPLDACFGYNNFEYQPFHTNFKPFLRSSELEPTLYLALESSTGIALNNAPATLFVDVDGRFSREELDRIAQTGITEPPQTIWEYSTTDGWRPLHVEDETSAFLQRGLVSMIGAADIARREEFGKLAYWLRVRWSRGQYKVLPRLRYLLLNTTWGIQGQRTEAQLLGSATGEANQRFELGTEGYILEGQQVEVREDEDWITWQVVSDFYASKATDRHYTLNRLTGIIQFGDGFYGMPPPPGANNVRVTYRIGGGRIGNVAAGQVNQLKTTIPRVAEVVNLLPASGGEASEPVHNVQQRGPKVLRHRYKAVTAEDYVDLAHETIGIKLARVITPEMGGAAGQVGLIIVPDSNDPRPVPSIELIDRLRKKLLAVSPPTVEIWITGPDWLCISVELEFVPRTAGLAIATRNEIERRLTEFFHPIIGKWQFGDHAQESDVYALIERHPGVDYITYLKLNQTWDSEPRENRFLVCSGTHTVLIGQNANATIPART